MYKNKYFEKVKERRKLFKKMIITRVYLRTVNILIFTP